MLIQMKKMKIVRDSEVTESEDENVDSEKRML